MAIHVKRNDKSQVVKVFKNTDTEDFVGMYGGKEFVVGAGKSVAHPEYLALHLARQLAYKMILRENQKIEDASIERGDKDIKTKLVEPDKVEELAKSMISNLLLPEEPEKKKETGEESEKPKEKEEEEFEDVEAKKPKKKASKKA